VRSPREAIRLLALAGFNAGISLRCVEPMLPKLAREFGVGVAAAGAVITSFALAYAVAVLLQGPLGDRFGKLRVVTFGTALAGLASLACGFAWSLESLAAMRLLTGVFASSSIALGMAYIGDVVPLGERQAAIAHFIAGSLLGQTLGPLFGGLFTDWVGWRASFGALGAIFVFVAAILWSRTAAAWPAISPGRFEPLAVHRRLMRRPAMRWLVAVGVAETFFFFGAYAFLGAFLQQRFDLSFTAIGLILAGYGVGGLLYSSTARSLIRALGERGLVTAGGLMGLLLYSVFAILPHWALTIPCTVLLGLAFYLIHNTIQTRATEAAPEARGSAVALYASAWALGQAAGVAAMGAVVASAGYVPAVVASGIGFGALGLWLRYNMHRLKP
jgi:predicted MFS family arabinose efflux permease